MQSRPVSGREPWDHRQVEPTLIVVSGAPGSGKTTIARRIADELALRVISRDSIKEALADALGLPSNVQESIMLGAAAYAAMFALARASLDAGSSVILDSNFRRGPSEAELARVAAGFPIRVLHCSANPETIERRYRDRAAFRHPCHLDGLRTHDVLRDLATGRYEPLAIPGAEVFVARTDDDELTDLRVIRPFVSTSPYSG